MSREDTFHRRTRLMSSADIDLDGLTIDSPPSPPLHLDDGPTYRSEENGESEATLANGDESQKTPFYDYACTSY